MCVIKSSIKNIPQCVWWSQVINKRKICFFWNLGSYLVHTFNFKNLKKIEKEVNNFENNESINNVYLTLKWKLYIFGH